MIPDSIDPALLVGPSDELLRRVESAFDALISVRGNLVSVTGSVYSVERVTSVFSSLIGVVEAGETPTLSDVELAIAQAGRTAETRPSQVGEPIHSYKGRTIRPKTAGQSRYVQAIRHNTITFGIGPAGTGKTYLAMAMAVAALKRHEVRRIVLSRPVVEAGESLGFLPGTLEEKLDPYVRPLYDALYDMMDHERANALIEQGVIEIVPLAYMRGRTLSNAFVILDEAQNTTPDQMRMFLTRLGFSSKFVVTGDITQRDVKGPSGMSDARRVLQGLDDIVFVEFDADDVVRHALVAKIVNAYSAMDERSRRDARQS